MENQDITFNVGDRLPPEHLHITLDRMKTYENWPTEKNVHCDDEVAGSVGFDQPICRGMMFSAVVDKMLFRAFGPAYLNQNTLSLKYLKTLLPGDTATGRGEISGKEIHENKTIYSIDVWMENQAMEKISAGTAEVEVENQ